MRITFPLITLLLLLTTGCGAPSFLITPVQNTNALQEVEVAKGKHRDKIAMIEVEGMLINARSGGFLQPTENPLSLFAQQLDQAAKDKDVKAVLLRVNSPGGTVTASDTMYQLVMRFKAKTRKPVIASMQEVAASGGYYVSLASDKMIAQPTTVVGSIGVIFNTFDLSGTMDKIGARANAIKSGPLKDMGSPFKNMTPDERAVMQGLVDEYYARFVGVLTTHRNLPNESIRKTLTDGRVFSGQRAKELGLIDDVGMLEDAIKVARKMADAPGARVVMYKRPYGYRGSIYADTNVPQPQAASAGGTTRLELPGGPWLPSGFYYLWNP
ncbi:MAG: protease [Phycisphaerales bacterium]|jgi:protease-4|nr:protease [Phycisphaerales bacterium]